MDVVGLDSRHPLHGHPHLQSFGHMSTAGLQQFGEGRGPGLEGQPLEDPPDFTEGSTLEGRPVKAQEGQHVWQRSW